MAVNVLITLLQLQRLRGRGSGSCIITNGLNGWQEDDFAMDKGILSHE